ncbi:MAG: MBL fold metallo-hydrolase [Sphingobacteriales bacterium]|nr:MBL fold metallo-hydrolase [Sphingobacteriales bacterium]
MTASTSTLRFTFLGTGTSLGVPMVACSCAVCTSGDPHDQRLRSSLLVQSPNTTLAIDVGPDFRQQMLRHRVACLDAVVMTHEHRDHLGGLDEIRAFNFMNAKKIPFYTDALVEQAIRNSFSYIFDNDYPGIPQITLHRISKKHAFTVGDITLQPIEVMHHQLPVLGFRIGDFTYITDANYIEDEEIDKIKGTEILVLNALRHQPHISHFTLEQAIDIAQRIGARQTYFTHISHQLGRHADINAALPPHIALAYDGLTVEL